MHFYAYTRTKIKIHKDTFRHNPPPHSTIKKKKIDSKIDKQKDKAPHNDKDIHTQKHAHKFIFTNTYRDTMIHVYIYMYKYILILTPKHTHTHIYLYID